MGNFTFGTKDWSFCLHSKLPEINLYITEPVRSFELKKETEVFGEYSLMPDDVKWLSLKPKRNIWRSKLWNLGVAENEKLLLDIEYYQKPDTYQRIAYIEPDFSKAEVVIRRKKPAGESFIDPFYYPLSNILFHNRLAHLNFGVIHGASVEYEGRALIFVGRSGVGKTTTARIWESCGYSLLNDERNLIYIKDGTPMLSSTPWHGEEEKVIPATLPLGGVFFLEQSSENKLDKISPAIAVMKLFANSMAPHYHSEHVQNILNTYHQTFETVPAYNFYLLPKTSSVELCTSVLSMMPLGKTA